MCGPNLPRPSLGGALAVLSAPSGSGSGSSSGESRPLLRGSLVFHSPRPGTPPTVATHATFTPQGAAATAAAAAAAAGEDEDEDDYEEAEELDLSDYVVGIHATGDLLKPAFQSPILHQFGFTGSSNNDDNNNNNNKRSASSSSSSCTEVLLATPLEIGVGGDGIIGRRVTVWRRGGSGASGSGSSSSSRPVAEGIVGYN